MFLSAAKQPSQKHEVKPMTDPQEAYRRFEGPDHPLDNGAATFDHKLLLVLFGVVIVCAIGLLSMAIFVAS